MSGRCGPPEDANIRITGLISDLLGLSGRAILAAIANGETDPARLLHSPIGG